MKNIFYHLSVNNLGDKVKLKPRVPQSRSSAELHHNFLSNIDSDYTLELYEDSKIKRICVSNSISGCLRAICASWGDYYYVYEIRNPYSISRDLPLLLVPDAKTTGERWLLTPHYFQLIGEIQVEYHYREEYYEFKWVNKKNLDSAAKSVTLIKS